jgi:hypothetical protein
VTSHIRPNASRPGPRQAAVTSATGRPSAVAPPTPAAVPVAVASRESDMRVTVEERAGSLRG